MRKIYTIFTLGTGVFFFLFFFSNPLKAQSAQKAGATGKPIPAGVMKAAEKSCVDCHTPPGKKMALAHLNLKKWEEYDLKQQVAKSGKMCNKVTQHKMPPKKYRKHNPGNLPTNEDIKTICDWAAGLKSE